MENFFWILLKRFWICFYTLLQKWNYFNDVLFKDFVLYIRQNWFSIKQDRIIEDCFFHERRNNEVRLFLHFVKQNLGQISKTSCSFRFEFRVEFQKENWKPCGGHFPRSLRGFQSCSLFSPFSKVFFSNEQKNHTIFWLSVIDLSCDFIGRLVA